MNPIEHSLFVSRLESVCDEMGAVLRRASFSPNIKDRLDFSCAVFNGQGELCAQAAHIPVHLGSMAYAMRDIVQGIQWSPGDMVVVNDPFLGGTHLPDVTMIAPVFKHRELLGFVANRAHHADIGGESPGSMPMSTHLSQEGVLIPPDFIVRDGTIVESFLSVILCKTSHPDEARGDFIAQISANRIGETRVLEILESLSVQEFHTALQQLQQYGERLARAALDQIPDGKYSFEDVMDDDGAGNFNVPIRVTIAISKHNIVVDFNDTARQVAGNINCPLAVTAAAVYYVFRCLMPPHTPACAGTFKPIQIVSQKGSLVDANRPAAVAAGNVETSTRIVDVVLGALSQAIPERIPAASHGSMNNVAMGSRSGQNHWSYYETIGGGMGAGPRGGGLDAVQTHMTNTLNTPIEVLEMKYPIRIEKYTLRRCSGGEGAIKGGDGLIREYRFLSDAQVTLLTERRYRVPWGLNQGHSGMAGANWHNGEALSAKSCVTVQAGDVLTIETPGGGGWGHPIG